MSKLSKEAIEEFKQIYKNKYHQELSDNDAYRLASNLLNLYNAVYSPTSPSNGVNHSSEILAGTEAKKGP